MCSSDLGNEIAAVLKSLTKKIVRHRTLTEGVRIDGRGTRDIRTLSAEVAVIPRVYNSALFQVKVVEIHDNGIGRDASELLRKVKAAQFVAAHPDAACPAKWREGDEVLKPSIDLVGKI